MLAEGFNGCSVLTGWISKKTGEKYKV